MNQNKIKPDVGHYNPNYDSIYKWVIVIINRKIPVFKITRPQKKSNINKDICGINNQHHTICVESNRSKAPNFNKYLNRRSQVSLSPASHLDSYINQNKLNTKRSSVDYKRMTSRNEQASSTNVPCVGVYNPKYNFVKENYFGIIRLN